ncbi:MAG TPA: hypothetical protein VME43_06085 [Bryobacteraceae bacterium]|nr:hypothetical protein [Bryobacteraceae bacterium]
MLANWKTTVVGTVGVLVALATIWAPPQYQARIVATGVAITSSGLLAAKDNDK